MRGVIYHRGLRKLWEEGLKFFLEGLSVSTGCQIIKNGAFQSNLCVMWSHLLSRLGWRKEEISKGSKGKDGEEKEKFLPGALHVPELRRQGLWWFCFCVCVLSPPETSPSLLVPMRKPKQETSFNSTSSHHVLCRAQRQTLCRMGHGLQQNYWRAEAGKPIWTKAEGPNKSPGKSETCWRAPSPKRLYAIPFA